MYFKSLFYNKIAYENNDQKYNLFMLNWVWNSLASLIFIHFTTLRHFQKLVEKEPFMYLNGADVASFFVIAFGYILSHLKKNEWRKLACSPSNLTFRQKKNVKYYRISVHFTLSEFFFQIARPISHKFAQESISI